MASQSFGLFLPTTEVISTQLVYEASQGNVALQQALIRIVQSFNSSNIAMNQKDTGNYITSEFNTGKLYFGNPQRPVFRLVVEFGALPNAGVKSVAHNLNPNENWLFTQIEAYSADPIAFNYLQIPYASPTLINNIEISVDSTDITITTGIDRSSYTKCYVVLEYIKN